MNKSIALLDTRLLRDDDDDDDGNDLSEDCGATHYCLKMEVYGNCLYTAGHPGSHLCSTCLERF